MNFNLTLIMQAVAFTAFIWFCARFIWPPLMRAIETRQKQIADGLAAGEQGRKELANAEKRDAEMLNEAKARSAEIVATGEKFKAETIEQAKIDAKAEGDAHPRRCQGRDRAGAGAREGAAARLGGRPRGGRRVQDPEEGRRRQGARRPARAVEARPLTERAAMAELTTIARPYAEAAFSLARETQRAAASGRRCCASPARSSPTRRWRRRSTTRGSTRAAKESLLLSVCGDKLDGGGRNFIRVLVEARPHQACCRRSRRCSRR